MKKLAFVALALLAALSVSTASAEQWPSRPITLIYPYAAGSSDVLARAMANAIQAAIGQPVVLDFKPGAGGTIGGAAAARARPDGYTLLYVSSSLSVGVTELFRNPPYKPLEAFDPIARIGDFNLWLFVRKDLPAHSVKELVAYAKANPGKLNFAVANPTARILTAYMEKESGIQVAKVPYKSDPDAAVDVLGGRIDAFWGTGQWLEYVKSGKLRALAVTSPHRSPYTPEVPTRVEAGMSPMPIQVFLGLAAPAGTPKPILDKLNWIMMDAKKNRPDFRNAINFLKMDVAPDNTSGEFKAMWARDVPKWKEAVPLAGIEKL